MRGLLAKTLSLLVIGQGLWMPAQDGPGLPQPVKIVTLTGYPPLCDHKNPNGGGLSELLLPGQESELFQGMAWDIVRESFSAMGCTISLKVGSWARAISTFENGEAEIIFPAVKTPDRLERFLFSSELAYPPGRFLVYVPADSELQWKGLESLKGKRVGVHWGFSFGSKWDAFVKTGEANLFPHYEILKGFGLLDRGHLDCLVGYELSYDFALQQVGLQSHYKKLPPFDEQRSFLMGPKSPRGKELLETFDKGKKLLRKSGRLKAIHAKYGYTGGLD